MTAINLIRQRRRACIMTDGAGYDINGVVRAFYQKVATIAHLRAAVAVRGSAVAPMLFAAEFGARFRTFDELVEQGGSVAEAVYDGNFGAITWSGHVELELFLAGWSESRNRPETYWLVSDDSHSRAALGVNAWEFIEAEPFQVAPVPTPELLAAQNFDVTDIERVDPVRDGLKVMEAQRRFVGEMQTDGIARGPVSAVGGFVNLTEIREDGISQRIIHRWNDIIGQRINPERACADNLEPARMSRAERRRLEKALRAKERA